jgi:site-specific recombinase XerD
MRYAVQQFGLFCCIGTTPKDMPTSDQQLITAEGIPKYLSKEEGIRFCCAAEMLSDELNTLLCLAFFYTGCRMTEILSLKPGDIYLSDGGIISGTLKQRKKKRHRFVPVDRRFLRRLIKFAERNNIQPHERFWKFSRFTSLRRIKDCMEIAEINTKLANSRTLRHSFAVSCAMQGVPIGGIQKLLGHAMLKNTLIYTNIMGSEQRKLISRVWPSAFRLKINLVFMRLKSYIKNRATK